VRQIDGGAERDLAAAVMALTDARRIAALIDRNNPS